MVDTGMTVIGEPAAKTYELYGLACTSEIELPGCAQTTRAADVRVSIGRVPDHLGDAKTSSSVFEAAAGQYLLRIAGIGSYWVSAGRQIIVEPAPGADSAAVLLFLLGSALTALLHQRDLLVLHASAVVGARGAVLVAGPSGRGKSTVSAALATRGYSILCDDTAVVSLDADRRLLVQPGTPHLKLWPDAVRRLGRSPEALLSVRSGVEKRQLPIHEVFASAPVSLAAVFLLALPPSDVVTCTRIENSQKFEMLRTHTKTPRAFEGLGNPSSHFRIAAAVAASVPIYTIARPRGVDTVAEVVALVEQELR